jgi:hypothetical protein
VLQNIPFDVIDWDMVADKFNVGVHVNNNDTVVGVDGSNLRARLDSLLPFPLDNSSNFIFNLKLEVDRIGRLLGFGGHLDFKRWCGGQIVQLKCLNGATKRPIQCD